VFASVPDLLRLLAIPFFGYVAWRDVETRRVPNRTWYPLAALAVVMLVWEAVSTFTGTTPAYEQRFFVIRVAVSVGFVAPLAYLFWRIGGFGGADAKAFMVIAVLFPTYPAYVLGDLGIPIASLPLVVTTLGVFSLTVLSNTVLMGLGYPFVLGLRNAARRQFSPAMFVARPIRPARATDEYGSLLHFPDRSLLSDLSLSGLRDYFSFRGLDLDALRMYLAWRGTSLAALREDPETLRDPASLPAETNDPGDGAILTDGGQAPTGAEKSQDAETALDDPWGAEAFLDAIEGSAYGTDPETLREGLDALTADEVVWLSPGIPFLVPLFVGLVVAVTYGDVLFGLLGLLGLR
jgi:preflagellin peptidase FlaK